jgi:hypothetical protein
MSNGQYHVWVHREYYGTAGQMHMSLNRGRRPLFPRDDETPQQYYGMTHNTTAMSHILFSVIPFKLASDASVLTPQKCVGLYDPDPGYPCIPIVLVSVLVYGLCG